MKNLDRHRRAWLAGACGVALTLAGCGKTEEPAARAPAAAPGAEAAAGEPAHTYEGILGVVAQVPVAGDPGSAFKIHHEHIPDFRSPTTGEININPNGSTGMRAMEMEMPPGQGVDVSGFKVGDKVRFTFAVWTQPRVSWELTAIEAVPQETPITFEDKPAQP